MLKNYILTERGSDEVFAVIKDIDETLLNENFYPNLVNKVGQAIEDEFCYEERVKVIHDEKTLETLVFPDSFNNNVFYMTFRCIDDDGEEEIREVELNQIAIY
jgi:predicted secreted acid phosphatase